jgi:hypothetical protein
MSISSSGVLVNLSLSVWSGRKLDRQVSEEVDVSKATKTRAGNYQKNLFAGVGELDNIRKIAGAIRNWHNVVTLPWSDGGDRLLPMAGFVSYKSQLSLFSQEFETAKQVFCDKYVNLIAAQAFTMGALFDRGEYPDAKNIASRFALRYTFSPVPEVGDWRIDASAEEKRELEEQYKDAYEERHKNITKELWNRLHGCLTHMADRLADTPEGERKIFRDTVLTNAVELCGMLTTLNITNDPKLEEARKSLELAVCNLDIKDLRESEGARHEVRAQVDDILKKFSW